MVRASLIAVAVALLPFLPQSLRSAEATNKPFFLPKSPVAAAYMLGRLSNKELIEAPRSEFVYVALLQRAGLERKYRVEALEGLAKVRNTDTLTELLGALGELDRKGGVAEPVLRDLSTMLLQSKPEELTSRHAGLEKLTTESQLALTRQIGYAAIVTAARSADKIWSQSESDSAKLSDLLLSIPLIRDAALRAALYSKIEPLLHRPDPAAVRRAAITAIAAVPGHDTETFDALAGFVKSGTEEVAAIASLQQLPRNSWRASQAEPLIESVVTRLRSLPVEQRTEPDAADAFQFATDLTTLLPPGQATVLGKTLRELGVSVFVVRTVPEQMLYDKSLLVVEAGKPVTIVLINDDAMPHNLVVTAPGALEEIGTAAEKMPPEPDGQGRLYVPDSPRVLHATRLVDPGRQAKLSFITSETPGDYPYVCTFPGHWRRMTGTLAVVSDVESYLSTHAATSNVTEWKITDLAPELTTGGTNRNLAHGKELFIRLACSACHKLGPSGINYGPDLTDVFKRYRDDRTEVLRQILEPSLVISNRYRNFQFELVNDEPLLGMILKEDADRLRVQTGPSDALIQTLKKSDIKAQHPQAASPMPVGLLNALSKEEILDLLAWLEAGGSPTPHEHEH